MSDPISRLLEAIEQAEQKALKALEEIRPEYWVVTPDGYEARVFGYMRVANSCDPGCLDPAVAEFIVDNDPSSVLRRCQADKSLILRCRETLAKDTERAREGKPDTNGSTFLAMFAQDVITNRAQAYGITEEET